MSIVALGPTTWDEITLLMSAQVPGNYFTVLIAIYANHLQIYKIGNDEEVHLFVRMCHSENSNYYSWVIYVIEGALLAFGAFLAWETRRVRQTIYTANVHVLL